MDYRGAAKSWKERSEKYFLGFFLGNNGRPTNRVANREIVHPKIILNKLKHRKKGKDERLSGYLLTGKVSKSIIHSSCWCVCLQKNNERILEAAGKKASSLESLGSCSENIYVYALHIEQVVSNIPCVEISWLAVHTRIMRNPVSAS